MERRAFLRRGFLRIQGRRTSVQRERASRISSHSAQVGRKRPTP